MDLQLDNKTAVVTGSTAGIGLAIASALAREDANVIVNGRSNDSVEKQLTASNKQAQPDGCVVWRLI